MELPVVEEKPLLIRGSLFLAVSRLEHWIGERTQARRRGIFLRLNGLAKGFSRLYTSPADSRLFLLGRGFGFGVVAGVGAGREDVREQIYQRRVLRGLNRHGRSSRHSRHGVSAHHLGSGFGFYLERSLVKGVLIAWYLLLTGIGGSFSELRFHFLDDVIESRALVLDLFELELAGSEHVPESVGLLELFSESPVLAGAVVVLDGLGSLVKHMDLERVHTAALRRVIGQFAVNHRVEEAPRLRILLPKLRVFS